MHRSTRRRSEDTGPLERLLDRHRGSVAAMYRQAARHDVVRPVVFLCDLSPRPDGRNGLGYLVACAFCDSKEVDRVVEEHRATKGRPVLPFCVPLASALDVLPGDPPPRRFAGILAMFAREPSPRHYRVAVFGPQGAYDVFHVAVPGICP